MKNRIASVCLAASALVAMAGAPVALAQEAQSEKKVINEKKVLKGGFDKPLKGKDARKPGEARSVISMTTNDGENKYHVRIDGDEVSAEVNDEKVPSSRIRRDDDKVVILDKDGDVLKEFALGGGEAPNAPAWGEGRSGDNNRGVRVFSFPGNPGGNQDPNRGGDAPAAMFPGEEPKVMLGITMSPSDEGGITVDSVVEGLPAEAAGIEQGDRIIAIDGSGVDEPDSLREMLAEMKPGDSIKVRLVRNDKEQTISVKLAKFDQSKFGGGGSWGSGQAPQAWRMESGDQFGGARQEIESLLQRMKDDPEFKNAFKTDEARKSVRGALGKALDSLAKAQHSLGAEHAQLLERLMVPGQGGEMYFDNKRPDMIFRAPPAPQAPQAPRARSSETDARLEKLMQKLEKLDERLEALEEKLDKN